MAAPLTYCSNIHPGESWADVMHNLDSHLLEVKARLSEDGPDREAAFPLGLRIAGQAAEEIDARAIDGFRDWCREHNCYLLTINGFPYGTFHDRRVKERVYLPDWRDPARVAYTLRLGGIAVRLQPDARDISISTVPVAFKEGFSESDWHIVFDHIQQVLAYFATLYRSNGVRVVLAIEPEPACVLETIDEVVVFFRRLRSRLSPEENACLGLCFDCCHQAVEFEDPADCLQRLAEAEIPIAKVQVSSALRAENPGEVERLLDFDEPVYLHQAVARDAGNNAWRCYPDLPDFARSLKDGRVVSECRVHFHVPVFLEHLGDCGTTQNFLRDFLPRLDSRIPLEVETYSFGVLPEHLRTDSVSESIVRELRWVTGLLE